MTRVLKRPMFRMGGNTDQGIMSGVVPRLGYSEGKTFEERMQERRALEQKYAPRRGRSDLSSFLIDFGLDVASRPPSGTIFSTVAQSGRGPFDRYTQRKAEQATEDRRFTQALIGDISEQMSKEEQERIKAGGKEGKQFEYRGKFDDYSALLAEQRKIEDQIEKAQDEKGALPPRQDSTIIDSKIELLEKQLEDNQKKQNLFVDQQEDPYLQYLLKGMAQGTFTPQEVKEYEKTGKLPEDMAKGGRVGYANAGPVTGQAMPEQTQPVMNPTATGNDLTFQELRARLPETVSDDVIQLLVNSEEALVEFANIQTERDITTFNRKYQVNLVLPQEA